MHLRSYIEHVLPQVHLVRSGFLTNNRLPIAEEAIVHTKENLRNSLLLIRV